MDSNLNKVGLIVGHCGIGTGATYKVRDEWQLVSAQAYDLWTRLSDEKKVHPYLIVINKDQPQWVYLWNSLNRWGLWKFKRYGNIDIKAEWAKFQKVDIAVEMHLNSLSRPNLQVFGHEVYVYGEKSEDLGKRVSGKLREHLGTRDRGVKHKAFRGLRLMSDFSIPTCLIEPAFIWEYAVNTPEFRSRYVDAVRLAIYSYFGIQP